MAGGFRRFLALLRKNARQIIRSPGFLVGELVIFGLVFATTAFLLFSTLSADKTEYMESPTTTKFYPKVIGNQQKNPSVVIAHGSSVRKRDFNYFARQLQKYSMAVKRAAGTSGMLKMLNGESEKKSVAGLYIKHFNTANARFSYEMFVNKDTLSKGMDLETGWQTHHEMFPSQSGVDSCQELVDFIFYEAIKKRNNVNVSHEVNVGSHPMPNPMSSIRFNLQILETTNFLVLIIIIFTVRSVMHDKEHMLDFMAVMGVTDTVFYLSHATFLFLKQFILVSPILLMGAIISEINMGMVFLASFIEFFLVIAFALLMASLFKSTAVATLTTVVVFFGLKISAALAEVCIPSKGTCLASFLNPFVAKTHFFRIVGSVTHTRFVPLAFMLLSIGILVALFIQVTQFQRFSCCKRKHKEQDDHDKIPVFKDAQESFNTENAVIDIEIKDVTKIYNTGQRAVHGLNLEAMRGQVTALLGHNGAGKTTTFTMICGTEKPTEGSLNICGYPAGSAEAKKNIGYCSQKNTLLDSLTVSDHLRLAYGLKCADSDFEVEMEELLELVGMIEYKNKQTKTLSGGQKRKLCLCMALIGRSSVVLLDEPTAGMDVESRQEVEAFLDSQNGSRTILLTTHYMDEAECLGDRVFIMSGGRVVCSGTTDFLKKRFASGYTLTILAKNKEKNMKPLAENLEMYLKKYVKDAKLTEIRGVQIDFELFAESKDRFPALFEDLEQNKEKLEIANFGLSMGNLEQVFLKVGHATNDVEDKNEKEERVRGLLKQVYEDDTVEGSSLLMAQAAALFKKKIRYSMNKWPITIFIQSLAPILILLYVLFSEHVDFSGDQVYEISLKNFGAAQFLSHDLFPRSSPSYFKPHFGKFLQEELKTNEKMKLKEIEGQNLDSLDKYVKEQIDEPLPGMGITYGLECSISGDCKKAVNRTADELVVLHHNTRHLYSLRTALNLYGNAKLRQIGSNGRITTSIRYFEPERERTRGNNSFFAFLLALLMAVVFATLTEPLAEDITTGFMYQQILAGTPVWLYWIVEYAYAFLIYAIQCAFYLTALIWTESLNLDSSLRATLVMVLLYFATMPIVCWLSNKCKTASTATVTVTLIMALGAALILPALIAEFLKIDDKADDEAKERVLKTRKAVMYIFCFFNPAMPFYLGLSKIAVIQNYQDPNGKDSPIDEFNTYIIISAVIGVVGTVIFALGRVKTIGRFCSINGSMKNVPEAIEQPPQVLNDEIVLEVNDVSKVFGPNCALAHVSFKVQKQKCFGLLGVSGDGKTTAFNIITGQIVPSDGYVILDGTNIKTNIIVGLCPQFDTLQPEFQGKQSLKVLATVHGYKDVDGVVEKLIQIVDMEEHAGKRFNTCSGGQKRRLSVAAALLPRKSPFVVLDEATAGIDPVARRDVWSVLYVVREHSAILMSSHSMEECDALCNRISILRDGQIAATGSSQELKSSLGNFYILSLSLSGELNKPIIEKTIVERFPGATIQKGSFSHNMKWKLPRLQSDLWSNVFERCQAIAKTIGASDFCVTQPSLQDIFLIIATHSDGGTTDANNKKEKKQKIWEI